MEPTSSVRRPESGTWQSVAMETAAMGGRTGTHDTLWTWQQHEEAVTGAHDRLRAWQQHEESPYTGLGLKTGTQQREQTTKTHMAEDGSGSSMRRRYRGPWHSVVMGATAT
ncbi:unnamed protein product, partial [Staurois parvus]